MLGVAYYENGFPGIALNHITANINTDGAVIKGECYILIGNLIEAEKILRNVAEDECNISSSRIASNLLLSHIALLSGNESDARRYILKAREIQKSNVDLNRFSNDIIWHAASLESCFEHYDKAIPLAAKISGSGNTIDKFKGYLVLASTYRCLNDIKNAENNLFKAKEALKIRMMTPIRIILRICCWNGQNCQWKSMILSIPN